MSRDDMNLMRKGPCRWLAHNLIFLKLLLRIFYCFKIRTYNAHIEVLMPSGYWFHFHEPYFTL
jgi:hypothetical protein